ncbi:MAG: adenylosuccinate lyase [Candidatus Sericytochromatia bacterium]
MNELEALSPLDGRYSKQTKELSNYFSESSLIKYRIRVESEYLLSLLEFLKLNEINEEQKTQIKDFWKTLKLIDYENVKQIEQITNHDLKAVEYFIKHFLKQNDMENIKEWVHFGLTSEDINNIAYNLMLKDSLENIVFPQIKELILKLIDLTKKFKEIPMLSRTHGQPATPTTLGKEFAVYLNRIIEQFKSIKNIKLKAKLNGATGNYNAMYFAYPDKDWISFSKNFIESLGLTQNIATTQIESHDTLSEIFNSLSRINNILIDMNTDIWYYISLNYFKLLKKDEEVGSSTMPHKVNPIDFENSEGNLGLSNSILNFLSDKLLKSRMQRDLSDSTVLRNIGVALAYSLIAYKSCLKGLNKIVPNTEILNQDLERNINVITEGIQTVLRVEGIENPYEKMKELSRGNNLTYEDLHKYLDTLDINPNSIKKLKNIQVNQYTGLANLVCDEVLIKAKKFV